MHKYITEGKEFYETKWFKQGFNDFYRGVEYNVTTTSRDWRAGWMAAESGRVTEGDTID